MKSSIPPVVLLLLAGPASGQANEARTASAPAQPVGVSPGGSAAFDLAEACPSFSWAAVAGARGYELRAYRLAAGGELEAAAALAAELPAGASSWTPPADACLGPGARYAWSVRARVEGGFTAWSEALLVETAKAPAAAELQRALEVVQRYLGTARVEEQTLGTAESNTLPTRSVPATESVPATSEGNNRRDVVVGGGPATAVRGEVPDAAGETYGVRGVANSPDGAGVRGDNNAAGPDLVLGGSPVAELTESSFSRESASNLTFDFGNPGAGTMTLQVEGSPVFHVGNDGAGSTLDADLLDGLDSTAFLGSGTDDWVDETGDTMSGTLTVGAGDLALHTAATVTKAGSRFLWDDASNGSFAAGRGALVSNTTGPDNTAVGTGALDANTTASYNTAVGRAALGANTRGASNTAVGALALLTNTTGFSNTAVGQGALGANAMAYNNTALGRGALGANTTGNHNTALGAFALDASTTANYNTALGRDALGANTTGAGNIAIGDRAGGAITTTSYNIVIGHLGVAGDANRIRIGNVGHTETFIGGISGNTTAGGVAVLVNASGELGTTTSSRRFKEDIADLGAVSERLLALRPISFRYTKEAAGEGERPVEYGLIAEEVAEVFPELVTYDEAGVPFTVRYHLLVPLLLRELQLEHGRVSRQEEQLAALRAQIEELERERRAARTARSG